MEEWIDVPMEITIRPAKKQDHPAVERLLRQIAQLHADLRPEIFRPASQKYDRRQYYGLLRNPKTPILIAESAPGEVLAHERGIEKLELNVWECNEDALKFYEHMGFTTQRSVLELNI